MAEDEGTLQRWFKDRVPAGWFTGPARIQADRDEVLVIGELPDVELAGDSERARNEARSARIERFREESREQRMAVADAAQDRYGRSVAWGAVCGDVREVFTNLSVPVMTRLRQPERLVLDTLVDAGVARSRSDALAWCVRLVAAKQGEWLASLREALSAVERVREKGPVA